MPPKPPDATTQFAALIKQLAPLGLLVSLIVGGTVAWLTTQTRINDVEKDVVVLKTARTSDRNRFDDMGSQLHWLNRKMDVLVICSHDPTDCDRQIKMLAALQYAPSPAASTASE